MRGRAAEAAMIDQEGSGQAQERFYRQERDLPAAVNGTARPERPELLARLADRHVQVISEVSHAARLLPKGSLEESQHTYANRSGQPETALCGCQTPSGCGSYRDFQAGKLCL